MAKDRAFKWPRSVHSSALLKLRRSIPRKLPHNKVFVSKHADVIVAKAWTQKHLAGDRKPSDVVTS